jgi:hypothetical protein
VKLQTRAVARDDLKADGHEDVVELNIGYGRTLDQWAMSVIEAKELVLTLQQAIAVFEPAELNEPLLLDDGAPESPTREPVLEFEPPLFVLPALSPRLGFKEAKREVVEQWERAFFKQLSDQCRGNQSAMARRARIDRVHVCRKLRALGMTGDAPMQEDGNGEGPGVGGGDRDGRLDELDDATE